ncbi:FtsX-like permease family protein [bacterium]|nr:FtsX-like permease family protein [bacterium]
MWTLAFRNIFRRKVRTGLTLLAIISGVIAQIFAGGFIQDILLQIKDANIRSRLGHLQVYKDGYYTKGRRAPFKYMIENPEQKINEFLRIKHVNDILPRVYFSGLLSNTRSNFSVIGEGIDADKESKLAEYYVNITSGRQLTNKDTYGIMLGEGVSASLNLKPGDSVVLLVNTPEGGALNSLDFRVIGTFQTILAKDYDDRAIRIGVSAAQELLATTKMHSLIFVLDKTESASAVATDLKQRLKEGGFEMRSWIELADFYTKVVAMYKRQFGVLQLIILGMVLLSVANSVNMTLYERAGEFGTLMALGNRRNHIFQLAISETIIIGLIGSILGVVLGVLFASIVSSIGIPMPPPPNSTAGWTASIRVVPSVVTWAFAIGWFASCLAAILPSWRISRMPIAAALQQN